MQKIREILYSRDDKFVVFCSVALHYRIHRTFSHDCIMFRDYFISTPLHCHNYLYIFRRLHRFIFRNPNNVKQECGSLLKPYDNQHQNLKIEYSQIRLNMYCENFHKNTILKKRIF